MLLAVLPNYETYKPNNDRPGTLPQLCNNGTYFGGNQQLSNCISCLLSKKKLVPSPVNLYNYLLPERL